jgi:hypothetical protein
MAMNQISSPSVLIEDSESTEWAVQVGFQGNWHTTTEWYEDRARAMERLGRLRSWAASSVEHRLACRRTSVTVTVEEV